MAKEKESTKRKNVPIYFHLDAYTKEKYLPDFGPFSLELPEGIQLPYNTLSFAKQVGDEKEPTSLILKDKDLPYSETIAKKIIEDKNCKVSRRGTCFLDKETNEMKDGFIWNLILTNPDCCIFKPTIYSPISNACNVATDAEIEVLMVFDEGYICPIVKKIQTYGSFSPNFRDFAEDILDHLNEPIAEDWFEENFEDCPNAERIKGTDGPYWKLIVCQPESGNVTDFEFYEDDKSALYDLKGSVSSIRLIKLDETIVSKDSHE